MKKGDLVRIKPIGYNRVQSRIGLDGDSHAYELGIVLAITTVLQVEYAHVWWFAYDTTFKGKPSEMIPSQYLQII